MILNGKEHKGVYALEDYWFLTRYCFSKKIYKTKESAIEKFRELEPKREIYNIEEHYIRFLWKPFTIDEYYETYTEAVGGFFKTDKKGRGAIDCWIIEPKPDPDEYFL